VAFIHGLRSERNAAFILWFPKLPGLEGAKRLSGCSAVPYENCGLVRNEEAGIRIPSH